MDINNKNILITLNDRYVKYAQVMLTSLFENNKGKFSVYCLYSSLKEEERVILEDLVKKYHNEIRFLYVNKEIYKNFPTTEFLTVECYFILLAHQFLPKDMERILYLDSDMIVDGSIDALYEVSFEEQYVVVCGQVYGDEKSGRFRIGARPERGECFNSGVIVFNLEKFRQDISERTYFEAAEDVSYNFNLADQGILNILFWDKAIYMDTLKYNFRSNLYRDYIKDGNKELLQAPIIIHYTMNDYYKVGFGTKPWLLTLNQWEYQLLLSCGVINKENYEKKCIDMNHWMHKRWWYYAKKTTYYSLMHTEMLQKKKLFLKQKLQSPFNIMKLLYNRNYINFMFENLTKGKSENVFFKQKNLQYKDLYEYICSIDSQTALQTMQNFFDWNCYRISNKEKITIAFIVYSSAEWQCEKLYRLLESDDRFNPVIVICAYNHGTEESIRETYIRTCRYFRTSQDKYCLMYSGYINNHFRNCLNKADIVVYISPFSSMIPTNNNMSERNLKQLCIHIPYGTYFVNKRDVYYADDFYNKMIFLLSWRYYAYCQKQKELVSKEQFLNGYNIKASGLVKIDSLIEKMSNSSDRLWKKTKETKLKIIWAPHFNLLKGMNGTFHENYRWFYEFAKDHQEISWIIRPHPRMEWGAVEYKVFSTGKEYQEYLKVWDNLPNARVIPDGDYYEMFATSDAMILDSMTFLMEYQYTGKPLLMLLPEIPRSLNEVGEELVSVLYTARGNDFDKITAFIKNVNKNIDPLREERVQFYEKYLNYPKYNQKMASEYVYDDIVESIYGRTLQK